MSQRVARMPCHVGQDFRTDAERSDLDRRGQGRKRGRIQAHGPAGHVGKRIRALGECADQTDLVEQRWLQAVHHTPNVLDQPRDVGADVRKQFLAAGDIGRQCIIGSLETQADAGQRGADAVVELAAQPPALVLPGKHELLARVLELCREPARMQHDPQLRGCRVEEPLIANIERGMASPG